MPQIDDIRRLYMQGCNVSEIARITGRDRKTISKYLAMDDFSPSAPSNKRKPSKLDPYKQRINEILEEDRRVWYKQRRTINSIYTEIKELGFDGGYTIVQTYVRERKKYLKIQQDEAFINLRWLPGTAQVDFGEADFIYRGSKRRMYFLVMSFPYSNMAWFQVFGGTTAECVCTGLTAMFEHIGGVPPVLVFDNATGIGRRTSDGIHEADLFRRLRFHYNFEARFCNPYSGHEKGNVERKVAFVRRNVFAPVPQIDDIVQYNAKLLDIADSFAGITHYSKGSSWGELFEQDSKALRSLPARSFKAVRWIDGTTNKYGEAVLDGKHVYEVSATLPEVALKIGLSAHKVTFVLEQTGEVLCEHERMYGDHSTRSTDLGFQLQALRHKPGAWRQSAARESLPTDLVAYFDSLSKRDLGIQLRMLNDSALLNGADAAVEAMRRLVARGQGHTPNDLKVLSMRCAEQTDIPDPGPNLEVYDTVFLNTRKRA